MLALVLIWLQWVILRGFAGLVGCLYLCGDLGCLVLFDFLFGGLVVLWRC